jgi:hypothetical protein
MDDRQQGGTGDPESERSEGLGGPPLLPCLRSNNSIGRASKTAQDAIWERFENSSAQRRWESWVKRHSKQSSPLSTQQAKSASALAWNVAHLAERFGLERIGFLTLTFRDHVLEPREAQRRFNSLKTNVLTDRYPATIRVFERQKSGRIHYHLLAAVGFDVRTGCDFQQFAEGNYQTAPMALRAEWAFWRRIAPRFGFGRTELLPVRSTSEGIAKYVGKYIGKHLDARDERDKGVRLVEYSRQARMASSRFMWAGEGSAAWRRKVGLFAEMICREHRYPGKPCLRALSACLGPRWAHKWREFILSLPDPKTGEINAPIA